MKMLRKIMTSLLVALVLAPLGGKAYAQDNKKWAGLMEYEIINGDTVFVGSIRASRVYPKMAKQKGRDWRKYYRLVHNFSKTYPYALVAQSILAEADSTIVREGLKGAAREKYIKSKQDELFNVFEQPLRNLTVSQGALLMRLIDREVGKDSFKIIKEYRNGIAAGFWQGIAKIFGSDLKAHYDAEGDDASTEDLIQKWQAGDFPNFYYSLFWEYPPEVVIPEEYAKKVKILSNPAKPQSASR